MLIWEVINGNHPVTYPPYSPDASYWLPTDCKTKKGFFQATVWLGCYLMIGHGWILRINVFSTMGIILKIFYKIFAILLV